MGNRTITATDARKPLQIFFDIELDDASLDPYQFRIYSRIVRRAAGGESECFESLESMAAGCRMSRKTAVYAIKELIRRQMVQRISRTGETSIYAVLDKSHWLPGNPGYHHLESDGTTTWSLTVPPPGNPGYHHLESDGTTKNIQKKTLKNTPNKTQEDGPSPIVEALEEIYPGHATNFKTISQMFTFAEKMKATAAQVLAFPGWLKKYHPKKANSPFAFQDLFAESIKGNQNDKTGNTNDHASAIARFKPANRIGG